MSLKARLYWLSVIVAGAGCMVLAGLNWHIRSEKIFQFSIYLAAAVAASGLKIKLPGILGTLSMNYLFIIVGLLELQLESAIVIGVTSVLAQVLIRPRANPTWEQVVFSAFSIPIPVAAAYGVLNIGALQILDPTRCLALVSASMVYFGINTSIVAVIVGWTTRQRPVDVWRENFIWTSPQYLVGGALAGGLHLIDRLVPWQGLLLSGPPLYLVYRSYALYLGRVDEQQKHILEMAELHWRTIEALALAIEAKDDVTAAHLKRVQIYAVEIAKELRLSEAEVKAVEAASLLHDIGKLAVPEYIISKPGRLTPEEFDKMKIHPIVGAEILERVSFPYPVVPMVRSHHEKYDGSGYPDGLRGEDIPIGARILSAVDCLDALASDRQYRRAVPLDKAMDMVAAESGKAFDPRIVDLLQNRYRSLEIKAHAESGSPAAGFANVKVERGAAPARGLAAANVNPPIIAEVPYTLAIANARREVQLLVEITNDLGNSLSLDETLALLAVRLGKMIPHDAAVIYIRQDNVLVPQYVKGESFRLFSSLRIPVGQGLSGWVVENDLPILNGNPAVEPGYLSDPRMITPLRSAISVPLSGQNGAIGALTLYHLKPDAFNQDHLRILLAIRSKAGLAIENSLRFRMARHMAEKDELTGLLNAGSIFRLLEAELRNASDRQSNVAVVVLDLDGFKQANDRFGHLAGNRVLQEIARGLADSSRQTDLVGRLGGDEFAIVAPGINQENLSRLMERLRVLGPAAGIAACGSAAIDISFGVALYPADGTDAEGLLERADQLMYEAKKANKLARGEITPGSADLSSLHLATASAPAALSVRASDSELLPAYE
jgi:diguanylate cyclase (GGDEF)-like protein/putative nucleotidyltransferase with HDIG domain